MAPKRTANSWRSLFEPTDTYETAQAHVPRDIHLQAMATVGTLLDLVDFVRLINIRDQLCQISTSREFETIPPQAAYREYLRFLTIKILNTETTALRLSPSWYIGKLWHSHILDTRVYAKIREKWPGRLEHDPTSYLCEDQRDRLSRTLVKYEEFFRESPLRDPTTSLIWGNLSRPQSVAQSVAQLDPGEADGQYCAPEANATPEDGTQASGTASFTISPTPSPAASPSPPSYKEAAVFIIYARHQSGKVTEITVSSDMTVSEFIQKYHQLEGKGYPLHKSKYTLTCNNKILLYTTKTLGEYDIGREATINIMSSRS